MSRPFLLDPLFRALTVLPGVGPRTQKHFERLAGGPKILDLLWHLPIDLVDRSYRPTIEAAEAGRVATIRVTVAHHTPNPKRNLPYRVSVTDETGRMSLVFFHARKDYLEKLLPIGKTVLISGKLEAYQGSLQMIHPDHIADGASSAEILPAEPIYPLTHGLTNKAVTKAMQAALEMAPDMPEWIDGAFLKKNNWPTWKKALRTAHNPTKLSDLEKDGTERTRLAYDELLANQLTLAIGRNRARKKGGRAFNIRGEYKKQLEAALPFSLTHAQNVALSEIDADMAEPHKMMRLVQGDVGSGKTVVAALAMMNAIDSGAQAAFMAPTEILARQHAETLAPLFEKMGLTPVLLTGRLKPKEKAALYEKIASGEAKIVIGTHALFQDKVIFDDLGLAVIDEQHRFGVHQRMSLSSKGKGTDILVMTATPIPRTLALTAYGDMDVSRITEKPPGRQPIDTRLIPSEKLSEMIAGLKRQIAEGHRVYWVCPLVEDSEVLDLTSAQERYEVLQQFFGERVTLVHGQMKAEEKDKAMADFASGACDILVATTVIEVGVNVPEATIMVIEEAHRFGLAQLHQLRGRVGRGSAKSYCFLLYRMPLGETAKERLSIMRASEDGFLIAEKDMELRGSGDVLGTKQSGLPDFKIASLEAHGFLLPAARDEAKYILAKDPDLTGEKGQALRTLLYLFECDQAITYLNAG
ncbi:MAG: ATP-dependent DNA helicase RecG [Pseudobdellovibrionaceae bacterium]